MQGEKESRKGTDAWMLERTVVSLVKCSQQCCCDEQNAFGRSQLRCFPRARRWEEVGRARGAGARDENRPCSRHSGRGSNCSCARWGNRGLFGLVSLHAAKQNGQGEGNGIRTNTRQLIAAALPFHGDGGAVQKGVSDGLRFLAQHTLRMQSARRRSEDSSLMQRSSERSAVESQPTPKDSGSAGLQVEVERSAGRGFGFAQQCPACGVLLPLCKGAFARQRRQ